MRILISSHISVGRICSLISPTLGLVCWSCWLNALCLFKSRERSFSMVLAVPWICRLQEPCYGLHLRTTILASLQPNPLSNCRLQPIQISGYLLSLWLIQIITICKASKFARIIQYRPRALQAVLIRAEHILLIVRQQKPIHKELFHPSPCSDWIISLPLSVPLQLVPLVSDHLHHFWFRSLHHSKEALHLKDPINALFNVYIVVSWSLPTRNLPHDESTPRSPSIGFTPSFCAIEPGESLLWYH